MSIKQIPCASVMLTVAENEYEVPSGVLALGDTVTACRDGVAKGLT